MHAKKRTKGNWILNILTVICAAVLLFALYQLGSWYLGARSEQNEIQDLRDQLPEQTEAEETRTPYEAYAPLYDANPDMVGWLSIEGTNIDYPVMYTPDDPEKYLHLNFEGEYASCGLLFTAANASFSPRSDNITIYGHNMHDGSMFHDLKNYRYKDYWLEHETVEFDTRWEYGTYQIFAAILTDVNSAESWDYYNFAEAASAEDFDAFVAVCKDKALYDTGITPQYGDELLLLSTCDYYTENGRMLVVAVKTN